MLNFTYHNPVRIVFGRGSIAELPKLLPAKAKILMTYGGGSIKTNGVYEQVIAALKGWPTVEFGGIEPNPRYETCMKAVELARAENVRFLLAVGGGSVLDGTKLIAAARAVSRAGSLGHLDGRSSAAQQRTADRLCADAAGDRLGDERRGRHQPRGDPREAGLSFAPCLPEVFDPRSRDHLHVACPTRRPTEWSMPSFT